MISKTKIVTEHPTYLTKIQLVIPKNHRKLQNRKNILDHIYNKT